MSRSIFGWDLPPGCTMRDIDEQAGVNAICGVCGNGVDACICPECPKCSETGNPDCYDKELPGWHGLEKSKAQQISTARRQIEELKDRIAEHEQFIAWAEGFEKEEEDW